MNDVVVSQLMATPVETVPESATIQAAATQMLESRVGSLVVVDEDGDVAGILTATDCVGVVADGAIADGDRSVSAFTTPDPVRTTPDESIRAVADRILEEGVHHVPVVEDGDIVGVITTTDLTAFLSTTRPPSP
jgi:CBS domain-containing protein